MVGLRHGGKKTYFSCFVFFPGGNKLTVVVLQNPTDIIMWKFVGDKDQIHPHDLNGKTQNVKQKYFGKVQRRPILQTARACLYKSTLTRSVLMYANSKMNICNNTSKSIYSNHTSIGNVSRINTVS